MSWLKNLLKTKIQKQQEDAAEHLRLFTITVQQDHRWLAHINVADKLTERYLKLLGNNWRDQVFLDSDVFRRQLGIEPMVKLPDNFRDTPENINHLQDAYLVGAKLGLTIDDVNILLNTANKGFNKF